MSLANLVYLIIYSGHLKRGFVVGIVRTPSISLWHLHIFCCNFKIGISDHLLANDVLIDLFLVFQ